MLFALRIILLALAVLTVVYICLMLYSRAVRKDRLEAQWDAGGIETPRETFVRAGLEAQDRPVRRRLLLGVYVLPIVLLTVYIYVSNQS